MKVKNRKAALFFAAASLLVILLAVILPDMRKSDFSALDFTRGIIAGMGSVTFVVWVIYLVKGIGRSYSTDGAIILNKDKNIPLAVSMIVLLIVSTAADYFLRNVLVSAACFVIVSASYVLNFIYVRRMKLRSACQV